MLKSYAKRQNLRRILVLPLKKIGGARAPLAPPVPTALNSGGGFDRATTYYGYTMYYTSRMYCNKEILSTRAHTDTYNRHATLHTPMFPNRVIFKHNSRYNIRWLSQSLGIGYLDKIILFERVSVKDS